MWIPRSQQSRMAGRQGNICRGQTDLGSKNKAKVAIGRGIHTELWAGLQVKFDDLFSKLSNLAELELRAVLRIRESEEVCEVGWMDVQFITVNLRC